MPNLPKQYNPAEHEPTVYQQWEKSGAFAPDPEAIQNGLDPFVIMLPPPNVTGNLHMGHALQDTIMDILTRYHRQQGRPTLWQPGTDHAAIATNKVIENQLHEEGKTRYDVGREEFQRRTEAWYEKTGAEIITQMKRLGCSCDWSRLRFTLDDAYYRAVQEAFVRYFERGYIYRGQRLVNWDPKTQTTVSDLEIEWTAEKAPFYYLQYGPFEISTARPETKFGDKYVVMHPDDDRYSQYQHGDTFEAEWINGPVTATIIKDKSVDPNFGTGVMTITPWHDANDFAIAQRQKLDAEPVIDLEGKLLPIAGEFAGQPIEEARPHIVAKLQQKGLVNRIDEAYEHNVARNSRGRGILEPQVMRQWFMDMAKLKGETVHAASEELVKFVPPRWKKHFITWMENVHDWNINRQIWLGHRLPVWWKPGTHGTDSEEGNYVVALESPGKEYEQDPDVLDTWFSSALWPFATLGWPEATKDLKTFYPTSVLVTGRDILYLWVARMIFSGLELMKDEAYGAPSLANRIPFKHVFIHPTVLTQDGKRMSKSLGTGVDPLDLINAYGADATRLGLMYQMSYDSQALKFDEEAIKSARNFANKLWNVARLLDTLPAREETSPADQWIEYRLAATHQEIENLLEAYKIGEAARLLYAFTWNEYADWYLEIVKVTGSTKTARSVFRHLLQLLHPFMPHLTEVLWQQAEQAGLLITTPWPIASTVEAGDSTIALMQRFQDIVTVARSARTTLNLPPTAALTLHVPDPPLPQALAALTRAELSERLSADMKQFPLPDGSSLALTSPAITPDSLAAARQKLATQANRLQQQIAQLEATLSNMRGKAPAEIISEKEAALQQRHSQLAEIERNQSLLNT